MSINHHLKAEMKNTWTICILINTLLLFNPCFTFWWEKGGQMPSKLAQRHQKTSWIYPNFVLRRSFLARLNNVHDELLYYPLCWRRHRRLQMLKFYDKVFRTSLFPNPLMDLVHIWYGDRYWSKILQGTTPTPVQGHRLRIFMLKFYVKVLGPHYLQTLWWIWFMFG